MRPCWLIATLVASASAAALQLSPSAPRQMDGCAPTTLDTLSTAVNERLISVIKEPLDRFYEGRDIQRFFVLETLARARDTLREPRRRGWA